MPPNPKRPTPRAAPVEEEQILRADDPRPQRVAQLPSTRTGTRKAVQRAEEHIPTSVFDTEADQEMQAEYGVQGGEHKPAFLYVERGPGAGQLLEVKQGTVVVGRASVSDLRLQHPSISRRHAQLKRVGEQFYVKDLGSQNGTYVNKERIGTEVEIKPGDSVAMGNALLRLRGPLARGEKLSGQLEKSTKARISTDVVSRPSAPQAAVAPSPTALKIAVFAGAVGFSLAAVLAFAMVKMNADSPSSAAARPAAGTAPEAEPLAAAPEKSEKDQLIDEAIRKKMQEEPPARAAAPEEELVEAEAAVTVKEAPRAAAAPVEVAKAEVVKAPTVTPAPMPAAFKVAAAAPKKAPAPKPTASEEDEEASAAPAPGARRSQILAAYEKGNAEASLEAAKKAGDKDLTDKLARFIAAYDAANDAFSSNNGGAAITNFQKALKLDEQLSSGWGVYGAEIRRQLANLYILVGLQFASTGDEEKAKQAFQAALKHDPNNQRAKQQLTKLGAAPKSADDAFEEEPAAKPAPAKKAAPAKSAIDDAFGD